jgi:16S rRNA (cytidine1402-2'-O)-methyltransferase
MSDPSPGSLILVAVPIGNLGDVSARAREALGSGAAIACEDTRVTGKLLAKLEIGGHGPLLSYREENEKVLAPELADRIAGGETIILVSDAGTPAVSDPGFRLVRACRRRGLPVTGAPGPNAAVHALSLSGLPSDGFFYAGFLPPKSAARRRFLQEYSSFNYTLVLYESCHRIGKFLDEIVEELGPERCICVCRELTKLHETVHCGPASEVREAVARGSRKGEFVVLVAKAGFAL